MGDLIDKLVALVDNFDLSSVFPAMDTVIGWAVFFARICVLAAPVVMLILGLRYRYTPAAQANYETGYRFFFGMGSKAAWQYTQRLAGVIWTLLGGGLALIMLILSLFFGGMNPMSMATTVLWCIGIQLVLIAGSCVVINVQVSKKFNKDGSVRK